MHVKRFTDRFLKRLKDNPPTNRDPIWSKAVSGHCIIPGRLKIVFGVKAGGIIHRIGEYPQWTPLEAEERAAEIKRLVRKGIDPAPPKPDALPSLHKAWGMYEAVRLEQCRPSTRKEYRAQMEQFVFPEFGGAPVDRFTRSDMAKLHVKITTSGRRYRANRVRATVRAFYNWLKAAEVCKCENPAVGIAPNLETNREFYLEPQQFAAVFAALDAYAEKPGGEVAADCVRFLAATGCRSAEARNATWDQFDSKMTIWTKPASATKQKKLHRVPLARAAHEILVRRFAGRREEQQFVFPDGDGSNPLKEIRSTC